MKTRTLMKIIKQLVVIYLLTLCFSKASRKMRIRTTEPVSEALVQERRIPLHP